MNISPEMLGSREFLHTYGVRYAYAAGSMVKGIASEALVLRMGRAGLLSFFGSGGLAMERVERAIVEITRGLDGRPFGVNLLHHILLPEVEEHTVDLFLAHGVRIIEAAAFIHPTPALVRYRLAGLSAAPDGSVRITNRILAKASRPEVAAMFLAPPAAEIVQALADAGRISPEQARLAARVPLADDICAEADSGGHTDKRVASTLMAAFLRQRDEARSAHGYPQQVRIGAAGGLGTPESIAAAFVLGADFVLTGSINQCTVEAGTSDAVKDLLAAANVQDVEMSPAGDMFEIGAKVQVLRKGVLFPARANVLYDIYKQHRSLDDVDPDMRRKIEEQYFHRTFDEVWEETKRHYARFAPGEISNAEANPKAKMALIFRWYFVHTNRLAIEGRPEARVDFQIHCGPAMGAFNQQMKGTPYESWRRRHVDEIAELLMRGAAGVLERQFERLRALQPEGGNGNG